MCRRIGESDFEYFQNQGLPAAMAYQLADPNLKLKFISMVGEIFRTYVFPGGDDITITGSIMASVDKDGFHRIWDGKQGHIIPPTWIELYFEIEDGGTVFKF